MRAMNIGVLIVDDHRIFREGLRALLESEVDIDVVGEAADGREAVEMTRKLAPDVIIMDIRMPKMNGIEATRRIVAQQPDVKVIALSMHNDVQFVQEMLRAGASGYLLKDCCKNDVAHAVRNVSSDIKFLSPDISGAATAKHAGRQEAKKQPSNSILSSRERDVLRLLTSGKSTKEIAAHFGISAKTVETYRGRIRNKLKLRSLAELTKYAIKEGLTGLDA
jgi:DNA-binding NarL/FixJ family response regulator